MSSIKTGLLRVFHLFDVAEALELAEVPALLGCDAPPARLSFKPLTPPYVQYQQGPLAVDGRQLGVPAIDGFEVAIRLYDFGVFSLALSRPYCGSWSDLVAEGQRLQSHDLIEDHAQTVARRLLERVRPAATQPREQFLNEDYIVFAVTSLDPPLDAEGLLAEHGDDIAALLRGEPAALSRQERDETLRHRISYLRDDLVVPAWNSAFVFDTPAAVPAIFDLMEIANSQLLTFRYYDDLLDRELASIYPMLKARQAIVAFGARRYLRAAHRIQALVVDVNELTDKSENVLKMMGDVYAARVYALTAGRLGLDQWKRNVQEKLDALDDIYRFAVDQAQMARGHLLELTIILILLLELALFFMGIMK